MRVFEGLESIGGVLDGCAVSVGNFDGVHVGHRAILAAMGETSKRQNVETSKVENRKQKAKSRNPGVEPGGATTDAPGQFDASRKPQVASRTSHDSGLKSPVSPLVVVTFEPHPVEVLRPHVAPGRLTPWAEKARQLAAAGADAVVRLRADAALLAIEAEAFVETLLVRYLRPSWIVEGPDFGFGRGRRGNVDLLRSLGGRFGFEVRTVGPATATLADGNHVPVSSTRIREALVRGDVENAATMLGRPYALVGTVRHGAGQGRMLGYPTINLDAGGQLVPGEGVYAGRTEIDGHSYLAAISIGRRPTMGGDDALAVEAFVLDAEGDWYGRPARVMPVRRLRDQRRFESPAALAEQIGRDVEEVRRRMKGE